MNDMTTTDAKRAARVLRAELAGTGVDITHGRALETVTPQLGHRDWNTAASVLDRSGAARDPSPGGMAHPVPVLRMLDERVAREFYVEYLHFPVDFEHRFEPRLPLYLRLRRDAFTLDLSEHHGDGTPGWESSASGSPRPRSRRQRHRRARAALRDAALGPVRPCQAELSASSAGRRPTGDARRRAGGTGRASPP